MLTRKTKIDQVCQMTLDLSGTGQVETLEYQGKRLYFCSRSCVEKFKAAPEQFGYGKRRGFWRRYLEQLQKTSANRQPMRSC